VALVLLCFAAGMVLRRAWPRSGDLSKVLDRVVLGIALPALILLKVPTLPIGADAAVPLVVAWAALAVAATTVLVASKVAGWDRRTVGTLLLVTPLANTSFLGVAAVRAILGEDHLAPALAYDQLGTFLGLVTYGSVIAGRYGHHAEVPVSVVRRLFAFPPFLALLASIPLRWIDLPGPAVDVLDLLAELVAPLAVLALGIRFRLRTDRDVLAPALTCLSTRMVLVPALALVAFHVGPGGIAWEAAVLESAMPPMVTAGVVATAAGLDERLATFAVGVGMAVAFVTLPIVGALL
jgi:malate permease and related proteins